MKAYLEFIKECDSLDLSGFIYTEVHHIIPKCFGGDNSKDNLIELPYTYHVKAHRLLHYAFPNDKSLAFAYCAVVNMTPKLKPVEPDLEDVEFSRYLNSINTSKFMAGNTFMVGRKHKESTIQKMKNQRKGEGNSCYDHTKYLFIHDDGREEISTSFNLKEKYSLWNQHLRGVVNGKKFRTGGWRATCLLI